MILKSHIPTREEIVLAHDLAPVIREVNYRLDPDNGDPEGSITRQAAEVLRIAACNIVQGSGCNWLTVAAIAEALPMKDEREFMETLMGINLLHTMQPLSMDPNWQSRRVEQEIREYFVEKDEAGVTLHRRLQRELSSIN